MAITSMEVHSLAVQGYALDDVIIPDVCTRAIQTHIDVVNLVEIVHKVDPILVIWGAGLGHATQFRQDLVHHHPTLAKTN